MIPFNRPHLAGAEAEFIKEALHSGKISGNGRFTKLCQTFFEERYGFGKCLLTTSCTDALEMAAILADIQPGDEVIIPSYTFVSTALAFVRQGATIRFVDSMATDPNISVAEIEAAITPRTKAIVPVHYAGVACDMDAIMALAGRHDLLVIEDAAQAVDSFYKGRPLGSIGHLSAFSFHETKNIISGEGGMLCINDERFTARAEIIWEKGTNRASFFRGEINKYGWVDTGSSFLPSEVTAAFLWAQIQELQNIQARRKALWNHYHQGLRPLADRGSFSIPSIPDYATNNAHMVYMVCHSLDDRSRILSRLKDEEIHAVFHYLSLHRSEFYKDRHIGGPLPQSDRYTDCLLRLPMYFDLQENQIDRIIEIIASIV